jgi:hypothetical protein
MLLQAGEILYPWTSRELMEISLQVRGGPAPPGAGFLHQAATPSMPSPDQHELKPHDRDACPKDR